MFSGRTLAVVLTGVACGCQAPTPTFAGDTIPSIGIARGALSGSQPGEGTNGAHLIYLNFDGNGGTLYPMTGFDEDSATNHSQIIRTYSNQATPIPVFDASPYAPQYTAQQAMDAITAKVKEFYAPFNAEVVTTRPVGKKYSMCIIGGFASDILGSGAGNTAGIAPLDCSLGQGAVAYNMLEQNITFAFAASLSPSQTNFSPAQSLTQIAVTTSQETAHGYGLEHTLNNMDVMYPQLDYRQTGFGPLYNLQVTPSECDNKSTQQDSAGKLKMVIGAAGTGTPGTGPGTTTAMPTVSFISPKAGDTVPLKFTFLVDAAESGGTIDHVEVLAGQQDVGAYNMAPYTDSLRTQAGGSLELTAVAYDANGNSTQTTVSFKVSSTAAPQVIGCGQNIDCTAPQVCNSGTCGAAGSGPVALDGGTGPGTGPGTGATDGGTTIGTGSGAGPTTVMCTGCPAGYICTAEGDCAPASGNPSSAPTSGTLGSVCSDAKPCLGAEICAAYGDHSICTMSCQPDVPNACGATMVCVDVGSGSYYCEPKQESSGCSTVPGGASSGSLALLIFIGLALGVRRRVGA